MKHILFVCLGNICRSPMAEYYMRHIVALNGLDGIITVSSAAISNEEEGNPVYPPARKKLNANGIDCNGKTARQIRPDDYDRYDLIIVMDSSNMRSILPRMGGDPQGKIHKLLDFTGTTGDIADPWYTRDFDRAWRDITRGCDALLSFLRQEL
ncbi:MAG: low molecular weight phosphotyrosine protein phosphatase [Bacteroidales bacterium]|nr:low molecular weight phosphotyrosine protein phosphatase [Bacteroidales bacterium]